MNESSLTLLLPEEPLTESPLSGLIVILYHIPVQLPPFLVKCANWKIFIFFVIFISHMARVGLKYNMRYSKPRLPLTTASKGDLYGTTYTITDFIL
ncbi:hypothetical protein D3C76_440960 [compost metagenome]